MYSTNIRRMLDMPEPTVITNIPDSRFGSERAGRLDRNVRTRGTRGGLAPTSASLENSLNATVSPAKHGRYSKGKIHKQYTKSIGEEILI